MKYIDEGLVAGLYQMNLRKKIINTTILVIEINVLVGA
jgi:hypothetical protein